VSKYNFGFIDSPAPHTLRAWRTPARTANFAERSNLLLPVIVGPVGVWGKANRTLPPPEN
jgi:hypothetical protein